MECPLIPTGSTDASTAKGKRMHDRDIWRPEHIASSTNPTNLVFGTHAHARLFSYVGQDADFLGGGAWFIRIPRVMHSTSCWMAFSVIFRRGHLLPRIVYTLCHHRMVRNKFTRIDGNSRILKWRYRTYRTIYGHTSHILGVYPLKFIPYIEGLIYGRYLHFRILEFPLTRSWGPHTNLYD